MMVGFKVDKNEKIECNLKDLKFTENMGEEEQSFEEDDDDSVKDKTYAPEGGEQDDDDELNEDEMDDQNQFVDQIQSDGSIRCNDLNFVKIIQSVGKCLLQKSLTPAMKIKKKQAMKDVVSECLSTFGIVLTEQQAKRKLDNLKARVKTKIDRKKTGNLPIVLNEADELLLNLLDAEENPSITQLPCNYLLFYFHKCCTKCENHFHRCIFLLCRLSFGVDFLHLRWKNRKMPNLRDLPWSRIDIL